MLRHIKNMIFKEVLKKKNMLVSYTTILWQGLRRFTRQNSIMITIAFLSIILCSLNLYILIFPLPELPVPNFADEGSVTSNAIQAEFIAPIETYTGPLKTRELFKPSIIPLSCNTAEITAWATGYKPELVLTQAESNTDLLYLPLSFGKEPVILDETDDDHWIEQKRDWFRQEFRWIFQLKEALAKESIEADYPELLIKTGDVLQFVCLEDVPVRFSVIDPNSLLKVTSDYGFDKLWLLENIPAAKSAMKRPRFSENSSTALKAFERWLGYLDEVKVLMSPTPIYSFYAIKYLAETRSLVWFAVRDGKYDLTDEEHAEILVLLQEEFTAVCQCQNEVL